jgi:hypothetical protein
MRLTRAVPLVLVLAAAGCGDDSDPVGIACDQLRIVHQLDQEMAVALDPFGGATAPSDFVEFKQRAAGLDEQLDEIVAAYDTVIASGPDDLVADITVVRDGTLVLWDAVFGAIDDSSTAEQFARILTARLETPEIGGAALSAAGATLRLDTFTINECGFQLSE